jgi:hypothetical protein
MNYITHVILTHQYFVNDALLSTTLQPFCWALAAFQFADPMHSRGDSLDWGVNDVHKFHFIPCKFKHYQSHQTYSTRNRIICYSTYNNEAASDVHSWRPGLNWI